MATDYINSNLANFGTNLERKVKEASANCERMWDGVDSGPKLRIWRIERFIPTPWPQNMYGYFHTGDSYIILKRIGDTAPFAWSIHFWLGAESSIDEKGAAAYKTVELDTRLHGVPVQYREVQHAESQMFLSYFTSGIKILPGGVESGFRHVEPHEYNEWPVRETPIGTVKMVDEGHTVRIVETSASTYEDRFHASMLAFSLRCSRPETTIVHITL